MTPPRSRLPHVLLLVLLGLQAPLSASAYVRTKVEGTDTDLYWDKPHVPISPGYTTSDDLTPEQIRLALLSSLAEWERAADRACTSVGMLLTDPPVGLETNLLRTERDNENRVVWRQDVWPHDDPNALAITTLVYNTKSGEILDADIDLNGVDFEWTTTDEPSMVRADVRNTLTHEIGHLLGFAHTTDAEATMFASSEPGETAKRSLELDDSNAVCDVYPLRDENRSARILRAESSCSVLSARAPGQTLPWALLLGLALLRTRSAPRS